MFDLGTPGELAGCSRLLDHTFGLWIVHDNNDNACNNGNNNDIGDNGTNDNNGGGDAGGGNCN